MIRTTRPWLAIVAAASVLTAAATLAHDYDLDWYTIDGGGGSCAGGDFDLYGTIGQPDAKSTAMTGAGYELVGGFWNAVAATPTGACCDPYGACTITEQANCTYPSRYQGDGTTCAPNPCPTWCLGDLDCSGGAPTFDDIKYFTAAIGSESSWWAYYQANHGGANPACYWLQGDYTTPRDGVEFSDIKPFAASIGQPCIPYAP